MYKYYFRGGKVVKKILFCFIAIFFVMIGFNVVNVYAAERPKNVHKNEVVSGRHNLDYTTNNSAKIYDQLLEPELGWNRYDDTNSLLEYSGTFRMNDEDNPCWNGWYSNGRYDGTETNCNIDGGHLKFAVNGSAFRIIGFLYNASNFNNISGVWDVYVDGSWVDSFNGSITLEDKGPKPQMLLYEYNFKRQGRHNVELVSKYTINNVADMMFNVDAIDVKGELIGEVVHPVSLYRYCKRNSTVHFYTTNYNELGEGALDYVLESRMCSVYPKQVNGTVPLYRYCKDGSDEHTYTTNYSKYGNGKGTNYTYEGVQCYVYKTQVSGTRPLYRYVRNDGVTFLTTDYNELKSGALNYKYDGIECYVI